MSKDLNVKILVVDDERRVTKVIAGHLKKRGHDVLVAHSGKEAIDIFEKENPQIVYLDIMMDDIDGIKVLKKIKKIDENVKTIMVTALTDLDSKIEARDGYCDAYLEKPVSLKAIDKVLDVKLQELKNELNILVVDDMEGARRTIIDFLKDRVEAKYSEAGGGAEALKKIKTEPCNIMILDLNMPVVDGFQVIEEAHKINPHVDILVVTAYCDNEVFDRVMCNGVVDFLSKPYPMKALENKVKAMIKKRGFKTV